MKSLVLSWLPFVLIFQVLWGQEVKLLTPTVLDLGKINDDTIATTLIRFQNIGSDTVRVKEVRSSCGCTVPHIEKLLYLPGEIGEIPVEFHSRGYSGTVRKWVKIFFEKGKPSMLRIVLQAEVVPLIEITPMVVNWQGISLKKGLITQQIVLKNNSNKKLKITRILSTNPQLKVSRKEMEIPPQKADTLQLRYRPEKTGSDDSVIFLEFADPKISPKRVAVYIYVEE